MDNKAGTIKGILALLGIIVVFVAVGYYFFRPKTVTIKVIGEDVPSVSALEDLSKRFAKDSGIQVEFFKESYETLTQKADQDLANGTGLYDIILNYNTALSNYVRNGYIHSLKDLAPEFQDQLFEKPWKETSWYRKAGIGSGEDGEPVGIPFSANTMILAYNKPLFEDELNKSAYKKKYNADLTVPTDWDTFRQIAEFFTNSEKGTWGLVLQGAPVWIYYEWANFAYSMGGGIMKKKWGWSGDDTTPLIVASADTVNATKYYRSLQQYDVHAADHDFFTTDTKKQISRMRQGRVAMAIIWSDVAFDLVSKSNRDIFGFAPIPGKKSMLAGGSYYVNNKTRHKDEAIRFIKYTLTKNTQKELAKQGLCPPTKEVYDDDDLKKSVPYISALKESLEHGVYMLEAGPESEALISLMSDALQTLFRDSNLSVDDVLKSTESEMAAKRREFYELLRKKNTR